MMISCKIASHLFTKMIGEGLGGLAGRGCVVLFTSRWKWVLVATQAVSGSYCITPV